LSIKIRDLLLQTENLSFSKHQMAQASVCATLYHFNFFSNQII